MFGNNIDEKIEEAIAPLRSRVHDLEHEVEALRKAVDTQQKNLASLQKAYLEGTQVSMSSNHDGDEENPSSKPVDSPEAKTGSFSGMDSDNRMPGPKTYYLGAPSSDGVFRDVSEKEEEGKSLYELISSDGKNGTFRILNTSDAIATALISVSQMVKPVCKIMGKVNPAAHEALTVEEGKARKTDDGWKVTVKADICFN